LKSWNLGIAFWNSGFGTPDVSKVDTRPYTIPSGQNPIRNVSRPEIHLRKT
jgi:hypothetical protein